MKIAFTVLNTALVLICGIPATAQDTNLTAPAPLQERPLNPEASFFYDRLAPYGHWFWDDPYGWVWTPNSVDVSWRPYTDGRWVYADCGWTWASDLEWGWAPFHYGRWYFHDHRGWCWVPGSEWAPAWVSWHWGNDWCGWAPMPPRIAWETHSDWDAVIPAFGWCFVAHADFRQPHLRDHLALVAQNVTLLRATRNVTRFEVRDRGIVNFSLTAEQVEKVTGHPVPRFSIAEVNSPAGARASFSGKAELPVYRPIVKETRTVSVIRGEAETHATSELSFEQLRRNEAAHRDLAAQQAREQETLERWHQSQLRTPPRGLSPQQLMEQHQAEHRAFTEHVNRQNQVLENWQPSRPLPQPRSASTPPVQNSRQGYAHGR